MISVDTIKEKKNTCTQNVRLFLYHVIVLIILFILITTTYSIDMNKVLQNKNYDFMKRVNKGYIFR